VLGLSAIAVADDDGGGGGDDDSDVDDVGIEPAGGTVGSERSFTVETFSAGRGDVKVTITNPMGTVEPV